MATLRKTFDPSKFQKSIIKSIPNISTGFNDPKIWISTGNYALNKRISNDFYKGIPLGKVSMVAGPSGTGKSFLVSGSIVKHAQQMGVYCVLIDTENALDESWLKAVGVDTSPDKLMKISASLIDDVAKIMNDFIEEYKSNYNDLPQDERPQVLFVIDSLGMLLSPTEIAQFQKGDMKGDMGRKPKQLKLLVTNLVNSLGELNIGLVATNHTYKNQDIYNGEGADLVSGGSGYIFASSIIVTLTKSKLREDDNGTETKNVTGIKSKAQVYKSRYAKPFEAVEIKIPYDSGLNPYSGLFEMFLQSGVLKKEGISYLYTDKSGQIHKYKAKEYHKNINGIYDLIMGEWNDNEVQPSEVQLSEDELED